MTFAYGLAELIGDFVFDILHMVFTFVGGIFAIPTTGRFD